jgi:hypothetical protein
VSSVRRVREIIASVQAAHPRDSFFANIESTWQHSRQARAQYRAYDRAFRSLDEQSWKETKAKALRHFLDHRKGQLKQGFFNQINEAFAYEHLIRRGCQNVRILQEDGSKKPDIAYVENGEQRFCEVKTIGISQEQIARWEAGGAFSGSIYAQLSDGFLRKLNSTLNKACDQITTQGADGLVFLIVLFDDFTMTYYNTYRSQILDCLLRHRATDIQVKIGLSGQRRLQKRGKNDT